MGWQYAIGWLLTLPYELTAAGLTIDFWRPDLNVGIWIAVFMFALIVVQLVSLMLSYLNAETGID